MPPIREQFKITVPNDWIYGSQLEFKHPTTGILMRLTVPEGVMVGGEIIVSEPEPVVTPSIMVMPKKSHQSGAWAFPISFCKTFMMVEACIAVGSLVVFAVIVVLVVTKM